MGALSTREKDSSESGERENYELGVGFSSLVRPATAEPDPPLHNATKCLELTGMEPSASTGPPACHEFLGMLSISPSDHITPEFSYVISSFSCILLGTSSKQITPILPSISATITPK